MFRIIKLLFLVSVLGVAALTGYAFLGDMAPERQPVEVPVVLVPG
ncbi:hypothetical protein [Frigidibacter sp. ROC022]|nr:hypothetical protein [Frigidibacter sp. ROC022]MCR8726404.1 hypothetical protein [Frigidibacter sp. ROC022]